MGNIDTKYLGIPADDLFLPYFGARNSASGDVGRRLLVVGLFFVMLSISNIVAEEINNTSGENQVRQGRLLLLGHFKEARGVWSSACTRCE